jgi:hypothetical protein
MTVDEVLGSFLILARCFQLYFFEIHLTRVRTLCLLMYYTLLAQSFAESVVHTNISSWRVEQELILPRGNVEVVVS